MKTWKPSTITGVEKVYGTSTSPIRVKTNASYGVLKLPSGCGCTDRLICEYVGSSLAICLDVQVPEFALIRTDARFVEMMRSRDETLAEEADGFISRYEEPLRYTPKSVEDIKNKDFFTKIIFLDTWIRNKDRYATKTGERSTRNTENIFLVENGQTKLPYTAKAIDHSEAFRLYDFAFNPEHFGEQAIYDSTVFGRFPEFDTHLDWEVACQLVDRLLHVDVSVIQSIFEQIPKSWNLSVKTKKVFISFIIKRAAFVAETLVKKLFPGKITLFP